MILGTAPGFEGSRISVHNYHNYITSTKRELAFTTVDLGGSFVLSLPDSHDELVLLDLEFYEFQLFATVGQRYVVKIDQFSSDSEQIALKVVEAPDWDLNQLIPEFEKRYSVLADSLHRHIIGNGKLQVVDSIFDALGNEAKKGTSSYLKTYVDFNIALIKQMTHKSKLRKFEEEYIIDRPVEEHNIAYMSFINQYFDNYFEQFAMRSGTDRIPDMVNKQKDLNGILNELKRDAKLANDTLRELILLKSLYEVYYNPAYREQMVLDMIDSVASKTKIEMHVELAENIKATLSRLRKGSPAPKFSLMDASGEMLKLSDLEGKYVYLSFWATWNVPGLLEMKVMPSLIRKYGDEVVFVYVSIDKEVGAMNQFLERQKLIILENKFKEYYLHYGKQKGVASDYRIQSLPLYVFLDRGGNIIQIPAEHPSGNIESLFNAELLNTKKQPSISDPGQK